MKDELPEDCLFQMAKQTMIFFFFLEGEKKLKYTELWREDENIHCVE